MIYELRVYRAAPGKVSALSKRFETITLPLFEKHGIRSVGFWTTYIGESNNDFYYMLEWEDLGERQKKWDAFQKDPEWIQKRAESEQAGPLHLGIRNTILLPTAYSKLK